MPLSSVMVRSLALAALGLSAAPGSFAQSANVTAFNPYNGAGLPGVAAVAPTPGNAVPQAVGPSGTPTGGLAFNPWIQSDPASTGWVGAQPGYGPGPGYPAPYYSPGFGAPPAGPIRSELTAVPEFPEGYGRTRASTSSSAAPVVLTPSPGSPAPPPSPPVTVTRNAEPPPPPPTAPPPVATPAPAVTPVEPPAPAAAPPPAPVATAAPPPASEPEAPAPPPASPLASITFAPQSAEIAGAGRGELDRIAKISIGMKQIELRAYATGSDANEARKIALARALSVRSYLIDQGVKIRIEVGAFSSSAAGAGSDRVDVLGP